MNFLRWNFDDDVEKKELAQKLRREGLSYKEIGGRVSVSKSTISLWCRDIELTPEQKGRLKAKRGKPNGPKLLEARRIAVTKEVKAQAKSELKPLTDYEFKTAGIMLYWGEGFKTQYVGISNSDPKLIKFMMRWFKEICQVSDDKFRAQVHIHSGQNELEIKQFWSKITGIPLSKFQKTYIKEEGTGHRKNVLYNGTLRVIICDSHLLRKILGWIEYFGMGNFVANT
jgi:transposase